MTIRQEGISVFSVSFKCRFCDVLLVRFQFAGKISYKICIFFPAKSKRNCDREDSSVIILIKKTTGIMERLSPCLDKMAFPVSDFHWRAPFQVYLHYKLLFAAFQQLQLSKKNFTVLISFFKLDNQLRKLSFIFHEL